VGSAEGGGIAVLVLCVAAAGALVVRRQWPRRPPASQPPSHAPAGRGAALASIAAARSPALARQPSLTATARGEALGGLEDDVVFRHNPLAQRRPRGGLRSEFLPMQTP
jgi:hypothetical protein